MSIPISVCSQKNVKKNNMIIFPGSSHYILLIFCYITAVTKTDLSMKVYHILTLFCHGSDVQVGMVTKGYTQIMCMHTDINIPTRIILRLSISLSLYSQLQNLFLNLYII